MREGTCVNCGGVTSRKKRKLCRKCFLSTKKEIFKSCVICNGPISETSARGKGKCRKCYHEQMHNNRLYWQNKEWLTEYYINKQMSIPQISSIVDAYQSVVGRWLKLFQIPTRTQGGIKPRKYKDKGGYINLWLPNHPTASKSRPYKREHVIIMEKKLGRILLRTEVVHHLNGIRTDNRIENLMYFPNCSEHKLFEGKFGLFAKQLVWGDIRPDLKPLLQDLFTQFCQ